jgi:DNA-binding GntR family transcriptional regulator
MPNAVRLAPVHVPATPARRPGRGALQVYETLREDILWLRIEPGAAIDEVSLAKRFDVSRTPIREALMLLAGDGLVVFLANRTSIVLPLSLHNLGEYMDTYLLLSRAVVRSAVSRASAESERMLKAALAEVLLCLEATPGEQALKVDLALRHLLGDLADNSFQNKYYRQILDAGIRAKILHLFPNCLKEDLSFMQDSWRKLVKAILHNDAEEADNIMTQFILAEGRIMVRPLAPRFGHMLDLGTGK